MNKLREFLGKLRSYHFYTPPSLRAEYIAMLDQIRETTYTLDESDRQATILALATLALHRPGFDYMLGEIAEKLQGREMYEKCKEFDNDGITLKNRPTKRVRSIR